jgi:beta-mannosidase
LREGETALEAAVTLESPARWSTWDRGGPALYQAHLTLRPVESGGREGPVARALSTLSARERFGIRTVELRRDENQTTFLLNGRPIFLRGTCYFPDVYVSALDRARYERDVAAMVRAGMNAVRVHAHVQNAAFYDVCDHLGVVVLQDSDINWVHPTDEAFGRRAAGVFEAMIRQLRNHPSIICWICMNEPWGGAKGSLVNVGPGPQLVEAARRLDPSRPTIKGSGNANDLESGDSHTYVGSLRGNASHYTQIYETTEKLNTEFGFDAPPGPERARLVPEIAKRLAPVLPRIAELHDYQYRLTKYYVEHYRARKYAPCSGYFQFMWIDLCPQSFYGVYDFWGAPKVEGIGGALRALEESNGPVAIVMDYRDAPGTLWVVNDRLEALGRCTVEWVVATLTTHATLAAPDPPDGPAEVVAQGAAEIEVGPDSRVRAGDLQFAIQPEVAYRIALALRDEQGQIVARNVYRDPFHHPAHPEGHSERMDHELGMRLYWA